MAFKTGCYVCPNQSLRCVEFVEMKWLHLGPQVEMNGQIMCLIVQQDWLGNWVLGGAQVTAGVHPSVINWLHPGPGFDLTDQNVHLVQQLGCSGSVINGYGAQGTAQGHLGITKWLHPGLHIDLTG